MARSMNLKFFYLTLAVIAAIGVAAIWTARARSGAGAATTVSSAALASVGDYEGHVMGSESAPVEIVEFADFQCPACARFVILAGSDVKAGIIDKGYARWRFHDFPLPSHDKAPIAHHAGACAGEQGKFWAMHDQLFYNQGHWSRDGRPLRRFREYASAIGLDVGRYDDCMKSNRYAASFEAAKNEAVALGVSATPSLLIGGVLVAGSLPYDSIKALVERAASNASQ